MCKIKLNGNKPSVKERVLATISTWWRGRAKMTRTEKLAWFIVLNGILWVWFSYILAYKGIADTVESVSKVVVTEILGIFLAFALKNGVENLSKNNTWPDKPKDDIKGGRDL